MRRLRPVASLVASLILAVCVPIAVTAAPKTPAPKPPTPLASFMASEARDGGVIDGTVTDVDYQRGVVSVATGHGTRSVSLMPSTSVLSSAPGYHAISDVTKGAKVQIFTSKISGHFVAQIIRLVKR